MRGLFEIYYDDVTEVDLSGEKDPFVTLNSTLISIVTGKLIPEYERQKNIHLVFYFTGHGYADLEKRSQILLNMPIGKFATRPAHSVTTATLDKHELRQAHAGNVDTFEQIGQADRLLVDFGDCLLQRWAGKVFEECLELEDASVSHYIPMGTSTLFGDDGSQRQASEINFQNPYEIERVLGEIFKSFYNVSIELIVDACREPNPFEEKF
jgi:hypothetical protein